MTLKNLRAAVAPSIGTIASFGIGCILGGTLMSSNFSMEMGDFSFTTNNSDSHALQMLRESYKARTNHLRERSRISMDHFESHASSVDAKAAAVAETLDLYLTPISHDKLFSKDIVIFHGRGKPTIMMREEFYEMHGIWSQLLSAARVRRCIDAHRIGEDLTPNSSNVGSPSNTCQECMEQFLGSVSTKDAEQA